MPYERDNIRRLAPYVPGEQPTFRETAGTGGVIKLNTNENPFPPSPNVMDAIRSLEPEALRLYPPPDARWFRAAAAEVHQLNPDQVLATNGGDELLRLLVTVFCDPRNPNPHKPHAERGEASDQPARGGIGVTRPSYTLYHVLAAIQDTPMHVVDRGKDYALPDDLAERWNRAGASLAFIVNPHAPSGRYEDADTLRAVAQSFRGVLVIDEAYVDFAPTPASTLDLIRGDAALPNVVILRSLSKGYSLAGLRFGYGLAPAELITTLNKARDSYNTDILAQVAAAAAVRDQDYARRSWDAVKSERGRLAEALGGLGFDVFPSHSNFLLCTVNPAWGRSAEALYRALAERDILIRYFSQPGLDDKLRITVGTAEQNDALLAALADLLA
jgi:histidinol-phosphate aminotransferase